MKAEKGVWKGTEKGRERLIGNTWEQRERELEVPRSPSICHTHLVAAGDGDT